MEINDRGPYPEFEAAFTEQGMYLSRWAWTLDPEQLAAANEDIARDNAALEKAAPGMIAIATADYLHRSGVYGCHAERPVAEMSRADACWCGYDRAWIVTLCDASRHLATYRIDGTGSPHMIGLGRG